MSDAATPSYRREAPDADGFAAYRFAPPRFNSRLGTIGVRVEGDAKARVRFETGARTGNSHDRLHGGFALAALDQALPLAITEVTGQRFGNVVTLALATQFVGAGTFDRPIDILATLVRETGRLHFLTGTIEQEGAGVLLSWQATLRKVTRG